MSVTYVVLQRCLNKRIEVQSFLHDGTTFYPLQNAYINPIPSSSPTPRSMSGIPWSVSALYNILVWWTCRVCRQVLAYCLYIMLADHNFQRSTIGYLSNTGLLVFYVQWCKWRCLNGEWELVYLHIYICTPRSYCQSRHMKSDSRLCKPTENEHWEHRKKDCRYCRSYFELKYRHRIDFYKMTLTHH